jgi:hypothetical protein
MPRRPDRRDPPWGRFFETAETAQNQTGQNETAPNETGRSASRSLRPLMRTSGESSAQLSSSPLEVGEDECSHDGEGFACELAAWLSVELGVAQLVSASAAAGAGSTAAGDGFAGAFLADLPGAAFFGAADLAAFLADLLAVFLAFLAALADLPTAFFADFLAAFFADLFFTARSFLAFLAFLPLFFLPFAIVVLLLPLSRVYRALEAIRMSRFTSIRPRSARCPIEKLNRVHHRN